MRGCDPNLINPQNKNQKILVSHVIVLKNSFFMANHDLDKIILFLLDAKSDHTKKEENYTNIINFLRYLIWILLYAKNI